jgi:hypothetical protein
VRLIAATSALVLIAAALVPQFAAAQDDGVFFDPGSPSDKEYAMPHVQARGGGGDTPSSGQGGGSGSSGQGGGSGTATPGAGSGAQQGSAQGAPGASDSQLFGEGVTRAQRHKRAARQDGAARQGTGEAAGGGRNSVSLAPVSAQTDSATGLCWFAAIAAAVALLGGGLAYVTRIRTRGPAT